MMVLFIKMGRNGGGVHGDHRNKHYFVDVLSPYGVKEGTTERAMRRRGMQGGKKRGKSVTKKDLKTETNEDT